MNKLSIAIGVIAVSLTSCAYHIGTMSGNAQITNEHFQVVDFAMGTATSNKILGLGGTRRETLVLDAKRDLYAHYLLDKGQALANVTVDFCNKYYIVFSKERVTVSAEIVDFRAGTDSVHKPIYPILSDNKKYTNKGFYLNEEVYVKTGSIYKKYKIEKLLKNRVLIVGEEGEKTEARYVKLFKLLQGEENKTPLYTEGEPVLFYKETNNVWRETMGNIICVGDKGNYIVKYEEMGREYELILDEKKLFKPKDKNIPE